MFISGRTSLCLSSPRAELRGDEECFKALKQSTRKRNIIVLLFVELAPIRGLLLPLIGGILLLFFWDDI